MDDGFELDIKEAEALEADAYRAFLQSKLVSDRISSNGLRAGHEEDVVNRLESASGFDYNTCFDAESIGINDDDDREKDVVSLAAISIPDQNNISCLPRETSTIRLQSELERVQKEKDDLQRQVYAKTGEVSIVRSAIDELIKENCTRFAELTHRNAELEKKAREDIKNMEKEIEILKTNQEFHKFDLTQFRFSKTTSKGKNITSCVKRPFGLSDFNIGRTITTDFKKQKSVNNQCGTAFQDVLQSPVIDPHLNHTTMKYKDERIETRFEFLTGLLSSKESTSCTNLLALLDAYTLPGYSHSISIALLESISAEGAKCHTLEQLACNLADSLLKIWIECVSQKQFQPTCYLMELAQYIYMYAPNIYTYCRYNGKDPIDIIQDTIEACLSMCKSQSFNADPVTAPFFAFLNRMTEKAGKDGKMHMVWNSLRIEFITTCIEVASSHPRIADCLIDNLKLCFMDLSDVDSGNAIVPNANGKEHASSSKKLSATLDCLCKALLQCDLMENMALINNTIELIAIMCTNCPDGSLLFVNSVHCLPSVIKLIARILNDIYRNRPLPIVDGWVSIDSRITLIQLSIHVIHMTIMRHCSDNLADKLSLVPGTQQAYIVAMTRMSFGDDILGLNEVVSNMAKDLLEAAVVYDEGNAIYNLFHEQDVL